MFTNTPQWLAALETLTFIAAIAVYVYNRLVSWKKYNERTTKLEIAFEQYQKDVDRFFKTCETCRMEVAGHHENVDRHVNPDLRSKIEKMADEISEIKSYLMATK